MPPANVLAVPDQHYDDVDDDDDDDDDDFDCHDHPVRNKYGNDENADDDEDDDDDDDSDFQKTTTKLCLCKPCFWRALPLASPLHVKHCSIYTGLMANQFIHGSRKIEASIVMPMKAHAQRGSRPNDHIHAHRRAPELTK